RRLQALQSLLREQQAAFNARCAGLTIPVLVTGPGRHPGQIGGRSPWLQPVHAPGSLDLVGRVVPMKIAAGHPNSLSATLDQERACACPPSPPLRPPPPPRPLRAPSPCISPTTRCCPCCSATMTAIWSASSRGWACA